MALDPRLCQDAKAEPPVQGELVAPVTDAERRGVELFLTGEAEARAWGREGWELAGIAREACRKQAK